MNRLCAGLLVALVGVSGAWGQSGEVKFVLSDARGCQMILPVDSGMAQARLGRVSDTARCANMKIDGGAVYAIETAQSGSTPWPYQSVQARFFNAGIPTSLFVMFQARSPTVNLGGRYYLTNSDHDMNLVLTRINAESSSSAEAQFFSSVVRSWTANPTGFYAEYARDWGSFVASQILQGDDPKGRGRSARGG